MKNEQQYLDLLRYVRHNGEPRQDRTGVGTLASFSHTLRYDIKETFPLLTTKKINLESVISELLWFLSGSSDERRLAEIRYGKPREELVGKTTIWTENANAPSWKPRAKFEGDLGDVYGVKWRDWKLAVETESGGFRVEHYDQITALIDGLRNDPQGRRHLISAWNPGDTNMALPPCHIACQFYVSNDGGLSCQYAMRSNDLFLGKPFNDSSYAALTYMIAQVCGLYPKEIISVIGDAHVYVNHFDAIDEQLTRTPRAAPRLILNPEIKNIFDFKMSDFTLEGYDPYPAIKAPMAV
jgi:thymidylate synthase